MKFPRKPREPVDINLAPLIDVVFILLLFFVVTTTFTRETQLKVDLPEAVSGTPPEVMKTPLEILVGVDGSFALNGKSLSKNDLASLMEALRLESGGDKSLPVMLSADGQAPHQAVVTAMDAASKLGFAHLRITTVEAQAAQ
ncbi:MAG: biopolymer transporter ExbD [Pseudomonas sp.]|nr:biopolymer transporter ExbD [Gammaproteobacteria bacterium]